MSGLGTATTQELGADDEVKEYQEEEDINEVDESLNDIKSELEQHAETYKSKTAVHSPPANVVATTRAVQASQQTFVLGQVNSALIPGRLPVFGTPQALDPSKRMLPMAQVYTIPGLQSMPVKMEAIPTSNNSYCVSSSSAVYPSYPAGIPVVPTTPGYPYVLGNPYVSVQLQQQMLNNQSGVMAGVHGMVPSNQPAPEKKKPHVKKPLNAFMLFMREKRAEVMKECSLKESAAINQILGKKWHALTKEEQEKYYELARQERAKHLQLYPGWSARDNYAIHKKRKRRKPMKEEEVEIDPNAKKCRARYGMEQQHMWCQPCRRKKRCARYGEGEGEDDDDCELADSHSEQNKINNKSVPLEPLSVSQGAPQGAPQPNGTTLSVSPDAHSDPPSNSQGLVPIAT